MLVLYPVLAAQFVLVDDHEILSLTAPVGTPREAGPALDIKGMAFGSDPSVGRFRPLYWTLRFAEIAALGDDHRAWHALVMGLGAAASILLYGTARALCAARLPALLLAAWLLVAPGVSSLWVRLGVDDTYGTVFLLLSLFAAANAARRQHAIGWDALFVGASVASLLSKESFALAVIAAAALRAFIQLAPRTTWRPGAVPIAAWIVLCLGVAGTANAFVIAANGGPLSYGGRYLASVQVGSYLRALAQNGVILGFVGIIWLAPLVIWALRRSLTGTERLIAVGASLLALLLTVPQLLLYSQQGIFEGKYETAGAIGVAGWSMAGLVWLERKGLRRSYVVGLTVWCATIAAFGFGTWTYARYFAEDSVQLGRLVDQIAGSTPTALTVGIAADPAGQYEPIQSLVEHIAHRGRTDLQMKVLPLSPDHPYTPLEANFAREVANSSLAQPPLAVNGCRDLGALIVLGDEAETRASLPCLDERFQRVEFSASVLLWGGEGVSLRPRVPGLARVSYVLLTQVPSRP